MPLRCRAKLACQIAGLNPDRLNEWIKEGIYVCAPETEPGSARIFGRDDVVSLMVFAQCIHFKMHASQAGEIASLICNSMIEYRPAANEPEELQSVCLYWTHPDRWFARKNDEKPKFRIVSDLRFNIAALREHVENELELDDENRVVG